MKKFTCFAFVGLLIISETLHANPFGCERATVTPTESLRIGSRMDAFAGSTDDAPAQDLKNIVKINASSLVFKTISLQYERLLDHKMSVAFGFRWTPSSGLPFRSAIEKTVTNNGGDEDVKSFISGMKMSGFALTPEFRYYFGKSAGRGFYLAPFVRYEQSNLRSTYNLVMDTTGKETPVPFKGKISTFGIGILIGSQFRLSERITLDWWIAGPYYTSNNLKLSASNLNLDADEQKQLKESLDGVEVGFAKINSEVSYDHAQVNAKGSLGAIRAFGLCLGVKL